MNIMRKASDALVSCRHGTCARAGERLAHAGPEVTWSLGHRSATPRGVMASRRSSGPGVRSAPALRLHPEQLQIDRVGHRLVARVLRVEVVARVEVGPDVLGIARVTRRGVEVDHTIESAARADPPIDRLPLRLLLLVVVAEQRIAAERVL